MAILRNREVQVLGVASEIDNSTFRVRYPDNEIEFAKMNELIFTQDEYDQFVKEVLPEAKTMSDADVRERLDRTQADETDEDKKRREKAEQDAKNAPEAIQPKLQPIQTNSPNMGKEAEQVRRANMTNSAGTAHPATLPGHNNPTVKKAGK